MTLEEIRLASLSEANRNLFIRASKASRLAKTVSGTAKSRLYRIKHPCIVQLLGPDEVLGGVDHLVQPGLLSISVAGMGKLHTHEAWLADAGGPRTPVPSLSSG